MCIRDSGYTVRRRAKTINKNGRTYKNGDDGKDDGNAVSYTHLDVYKRQLLQHIINENNKEDTQII